MSNKKNSKTSISVYSEVFVSWMFLLVLIDGPEKGSKRSEIEEALPEEVKQIRNLSRKVEQVLNKMIREGVVEIIDQREEGRFFKLTDNGRIQAEAIKQYFEGQNI